jgi:hypothetical protein
MLFSAITVNPSLCSFVEGGGLRSVTSTPKPFRFLRGQPDAARDFLAGVSETQPVFIKRAEGRDYCQVDIVNRVETALNMLRLASDEAEFLFNCLKILILRTSHFLYTSFRQGAKFESDKLYRKRISLSI